MKKHYDSLYKRSSEQDLTTAFAYFKFPRLPGNGGLDFWAPFRLLGKLAQTEYWESHEMVNGQLKFPVGNMATLASYLNFTFMRLQEEDKILYSGDGLRACFNTGLLDRNYGNDIHAFFSRNKSGERAQDWCFDEFEIQTMAMRRKRLDGFPGLPKPAEYYNADNYRDLFFNIEYETIVISEHIVEDNMDRMPLSLGNNPHVIYTLIKGAVDKLYEQIRRNYKLPVPHWHEGHIQLLLPLCLTHPGKADLALLVERKDEQKCYLAKTILTMDMAYKDARLICRPNSDWLKGW